MQQKSITLKFQVSEPNEEIASVPSPWKEGERLDAVASITLSLILDTVRSAASFMFAAKPSAKSIKAYYRHADALDALDRLVANDPFLVMLLQEIRQGTISVNGYDLRAFTAFGKMLGALKPDARRGEEVSK